MHCYQKEKVSTLKGDDSGCINKPGTCQVNSITCPGGYVNGLCTGAANRQCCKNDSACINKPGTCQLNTMPCTGGYVSGLFTGANNRQCCPGHDSACTNQQGTCQDDSSYCAGSYQSGLCSGSASRRCCVPTSSDPCTLVTIIPRATWGATAATSVTFISTAVSKFFIHHTAGSTCSSQADCIPVVKTLQSYHMNTKGWNDIGYSFLVGGDGNVYEGRGWGRQGAHTSGYNHVSYAASFMGDYTSTLPPTSALTAAQNIITCGIHLGRIAINYKLLGHRDVGSTACPGNKLYAEIQNWHNYTSTP